MIQYRWLIGYVVVLALCVLFFPCTAMEPEKAISGEWNDSLSMDSREAVWDLGGNGSDLFLDGAGSENTEDIDRTGKSTYEYYLPYFLSNSAYGTGVALKNSDISGSANVNVFSNSAGQDAWFSILQTETIPLRGQKAFLMDPGEGWVKVTSDKRLTGLAFVAEATGNKLMFDITLIPETTSVLHVPHVAQNANWDTIVYVCNPNGMGTEVCFDVIRSNGTVVATQCYDLPAGGSGVYPLSSVLGGATCDSGSVEIMADYGVAAFALYHNLKTGACSYAGISAVDPLMFTGSAISYEYYLPYFLSDSAYGTGVALKNGNAFYSAYVTVSSISQGGLVFDTQTETIPPRGQKAFLMDPGEGWVKVTSNRPLTGLAFVAEATGNKLMFDITLIPSKSIVLHVPHVAQNAKWDTVVYVCNPIGMETDLCFEVIRSNGTVVATHCYDLPAGGSGVYPLSDILGGVVPCDSGSVEITANNGVAAFALYHNLKTGACSYAGISAVDPTTSTPIPCNLSISPISDSFDDGGGTGTVSLTASHHSCTWTAVSNDPSWLHVIGFGGTGNGIVNYSVDAYSGNSDRTGTLTIAGETFTVTQEPPTACTYEISSSSNSFDAGGGTETVSVTASPSSCTWTAVSNDPSWLHVTDGSSGAGSGMVSYAVDENNNNVSDREGILTIAGKTLTVTQLACTYSITPTSRDFRSSGGTGTVEMTASSSLCPRMIESTAPSWLHITSTSTAMRDTTVTYAVDENHTSLNRTGTLILAGNIHTVTQSPCFFTFTPVSETISHSGGSASVSVTASSSWCTWTAVSNDSWIHITSGSSGTGNGTVTYLVDAHTGTSYRPGTITIGGEIFHVDQLACWFGISPTSAYISAWGGTGSVSVSASYSTCGWTAVSNDSWIHITSGSSGTGNGTVTYSVDLGEIESRSGTMTIGGKTFTVNQQGYGF